MKDAAQLDKAAQAAGAEAFLCTEKDVFNLRTALLPACRLRLPHSVGAVRRRRFLARGHGGRYLVNQRAANRERHVKILIRATNWVETRSWPSRRCKRSAAARPTRSFPCSRVHGWRTSIAGRAIGVYCGAADGWSALLEQDLGILTFGYVVCADTEKEAQDYYEYYVGEKGDYIAAQKMIDLMLAGDSRSLPKRVRCQDAAATDRWLGRCPPGGHT